MFKRIIKETKLSMKRNPVKIVLSALIILISTTIIFSGVLLHREVNTALNNMDEYSKRHASFEYIDPSLVPDKRLELGEGKPLIEDSFIDEFHQIINAQTWYYNLFESFSRYGDESYYTTYNYNIEDLGIYPGAQTKEMKYKEESVFFTYANLVDFPSNNTIDDRVTLKEGSFPFEEKSSIAISQSFAKRNQLKIGDKIEIDSPTDNYIHEVVGIYDINIDGVKDSVIFVDPMNYQMIMENSQGSRPEVNVGIARSFIFPTVEDAESSITVANRVLFQNTDMDNVQIVNKTEENNLFMNSLKSVKIGIYIMLLLIVFLSVYLLKNIMQNDIREYQEDRFNSVFEEDRELVRKSNCLQMTIVVIFSILISFFSAPAINELLMKPLLISNLDFKNDPDRIDDELLTEFMDMDVVDEVMTFTSNYDIFLVKKFEFKPDVLYTTVSVVLVGALGTVAVILGNRPPKKENE